DQCEGPFARPQPARRRKQGYVVDIVDFGLGQTAEQPVQRRGAVGRPGMAEEIADGRIISSVAQNKTAIPMKRQLLGQHLSILRKTRMNHIGDGDDGIHVAGRHRPPGGPPTIPSHDYSSPIRRNQASSSMVSMPSSFAFANFEPAPGPATMRSVFFETDPAVFAPKRSAIALASSRDIRSNAPVNTMV